MTPLWIVPLAAVALAQTAIIATSMYLHRGLAHRSLAFHPAADVLFRTVLWLTTGQDRREWVAVHRKHHAFTDRDGDPHSPRLRGFWRVQFLNAYYYMREAHNPETIRRFASDIREDQLDRALFSRAWVGLTLGITLLCLVLGTWPGLIAASVHAVLYVFVLAPLINGLGHWRGGPELQQHRVQLTRPRLGDGRREPAQQSPRPSPVAEVQRATVRVRSVVAGDPCARDRGNPRGHRDTGHAGPRRRTIR
jgi:fatty-acid desaturase